ncbi:MAG: hypothetical protein ABI682_08530 [Acidobacteriota bacterium]
MVTTTAADPHSGPPLSDAELLRGFESCALPPGRFHHAEHVRVVWIYLSLESVLGTLERFPAALRRYAESLGIPELYHETITWALVLLIEERRQRGGELSWEEFASANEDLLSWPDVLDRYYRPGTLARPEAKRIFLLPDRLETPAPDPAGGRLAGGSG